MRRERSCTIQNLPDLRVRDTDVTVNRMSALQGDVMALVERLAHDREALELVVQTAELLARNRRKKSRGSTIPRR